MLSLGGAFEYYDLFLMGYVGPGLVRSGLFTAGSASLFGLSGLATFVAATFAGLFAGTLLFSVAADRFGRRAVFTWSLLWYTAATCVMAMQTSTGGVLLWRAITGVGIGVELVTIDTYIAELMPRQPLYVAYLPEDAQAVIGQVHRSTLPARKLLEQEGMHYEGYVDIFDAGPTVECFRDNIDAVRRSHVLPVTLGEEDPVPDSLTDDVPWLVSNRKFEDYRALVTAAPARVDRFPLLPYAAAALGVGEGDSVRAVPLSPRDR